jgi:hypothetical protein
MNESGLKIFTDFTLKLIEFNNSRIHLSFTVFGGTLLAGIFIASLKGPTLKHSGRFWLVVLFAILAFGFFASGLDMIRQKMANRNNFIHQWCGAYLACNTQSSAQHAIASLNHDYSNFLKIELDDLNWFPLCNPITIFLSISGFCLCLALVVRMASPPSEST